MSKQSLNYNSIPCWVCILENENDEIFQIIYTLHLDEYLQKIEDENQQVIYSRKFENLLDGIGHKLFLEELSPSSIRRFAQIHNPEYKNRSTI